MSLLRLTDLVGHIGAVTVEEFTIRVVIRDVKISYGRELVMVEPVEGAGTGSKWVRLDRVHMLQR